jgi:hypothetical protein
MLVEVELDSHVCACDSRLKQHLRYDLAMCNGRKGILVAMAVSLGSYF